MSFATAQLKNPPLMTALARQFHNLADYIKRRLPGRDFARDLMHDVCVRMLEKPPGEPIASPLAFPRVKLLSTAPSTASARIVIGRFT